MPRAVVLFKHCAINIPDCFANNQKLELYRALNFNVG